MENQEEFQEKLKELIEGVRLAHKRGAYSMEESAMLWGTIKYFIEDPE
jgi:hypothetical protein